MKKLFLIIIFCLTTKLYGYSFVFIPDSQYDTAVSSVVFGNQCQWIVDDPLGLDIEYMCHVGDIVDHGYDQTQWDNAMPGLNIIRAANLPMTIAIGNHGYNTERDATNYLLNIDTNTFYGDKDWFNGSFSTNVAGNSYNTMTVDNDDWVILTLEYDARPNVIAWATNTLVGLSYDYLLIVSHEYLNNNTDTVATTALLIESEIVNKQTVPTFIISGHWLGSGLLVEYTANVKKKTAYGFCDHSIGNHGSVVIMDFNPTTKIVNYRIYYVEDVAYGDVGFDIKYDTPDTFGTTSGRTLRR